MSADLVAFLRAMLDEDERVAEGVSPGGPSPLWHLDDDHGHDALVIDSARVLAEVAAKRRIIDEWLGAQAEAERGDPSGRIAAFALVLVLRLLALPYAEADGYREEWRPA